MTDKPVTHGRDATVSLGLVREISATVHAAHRFVYLIPETLEEAGALGDSSGSLAGPGYYAFRGAALGAVPWRVVLAAFYNFSPLAVQQMAGVWDLATPEQWQSARFAAVGRAMRRVGVGLTAEQIAEARSLIDPVVAAADLAGKPLAAANASVVLPADPLVALWQQITVLREWRGDAHALVLAAHDLGPCECTVIQTATGRFPLALARATRLWSDEEWTTATSRLAARGWLDVDGIPTTLGTQAREQVEIETDVQCGRLWNLIGPEPTRRLRELMQPIDDAFVASGIYGQMR